MIQYLLDKGMTNGEAKVIEKLLQGKSNPQIAVELCLSEKTIKFHLTRVYKKMGFKTARELMASLLVISPQVLLSNNKVKDSEGPREDLN